MNFDAETMSVKPESFPVPMILDTDTYNEIDDQFALIYALLAPEKINFRAITAAPFFNDRSSSAEDGMEKSFEEIERILKLTGFHGEVPAFRGSRAFMRDRKTPVKSEAAEAIITEARAAGERGEKLFISAIACLTNVASALLIAPEIAQHVVIVWLGGHAYGAGHNGEFNLAGDVAATQAVFDSGAPMVRYPCTGVVDALTTTIPELAGHLRGCGVVGDYLAEIFSDYVTSHGETSGKVIWDISAISFFIIPDAATWEIGPMPNVEDDRRWIYPATGRKIRTATGIDRDRVFREIFDRIRKHEAGRR